MDNPGVLIAVDTILLYLLLGPIVLFGFYVYFDKIGKPGQMNKKAEKKDVALLSSDDLKEYYESSINW